MCCSNMWTIPTCGMSDHTNCWTVHYFWGDSPVSGQLERLGCSHTPVDVCCRSGGGAVPQQHLRGAVQMVDVPTGEARAHSLKVLLPEGREAIVLKTHKGEVIRIDGRWCFTSVNDSCASNAVQIARQWLNGGFGLTIYLILLVTQFVLHVFFHWNFLTIRFTHIRSDLSGIRYHWSQVSEKSRLDKWGTDRMPKLIQ